MLVNKQSISNILKNIINKQYFLFNDIKVFSINSGRMFILKKSGLPFN